MIVATDSQFERARDVLGAIGGAAERAMAAALNAAAAAARDEAVQAIAGRYAVQASDVRGKIALTTARPEALGVVVTLRSGPLSLTHFPHTPTEPGTGGRGRPPLRAEIVRGQPKEIPGAFIAPINGQPRIMLRAEGKSRTGRDKLKSAAGMPIANMLGVASVREAVEDRAIAVLDARLDRELDRALGRVA